MDPIPEPPRNQIDGRWLLEPMVEVVLTLQARSDWTWRHLGRVARYAVAFGRRLGLDAEAMMTLQCGAMLHDVGKLVVPNAILDKSSPLDRDEWYAITKHSMVSGQMLKAHALPLSVARVAQSHHEWYNGAGYPMGLQGDAIPLGARVLSLADAYDAMSSDRPYRPALSTAEIIAEIDRGTGTQFDPGLVAVLKPLIEEGLETFVPRRTMRVVSDDPALFRELWFAAHPWGWELEPWPVDWAGACPPELRSGLDVTAPAGAVDLTVVDCRSAHKLPAGVLETVEGPVLWVDPAECQAPSVRPPLDLRSLLAVLQPGGDWGFGRSKDADRVKVLVADPFKLFRQVLVRYLDHREDVQVVGAVDSPGAYRRVLGGGGVDVAVVASDLVVGTRTSRELRPGDTLLAEQEGFSGELPAVPSVVLVADEDLDDPAHASELGPQGLWEPGRPVRARRVYIPRGAPAEMLIAAIKAVRESTVDLQGPGASSAQLPWYGDAHEQQSEMWF